ncbi:hypothetical protein L6452_30226 [Arctium lappa]|uniref:Uncharacterized protein n=1 Tax=Arctium lappa TaxID=4217 RepID=A0ACB8ZI52_ARCLA|nr:hypothetical protein L6452_30226 [Arctium lappa]
MCLIYMWQVKLGRLRYHLSAAFIVLHSSTSFGAQTVIVILVPSPTSSSPPALGLPNWLKLRGTNVLLRYLGRTTTTIPSLYQGDAFGIGQIDEWLDYAPIFSSGSEYEGACKYVDGYLPQRTFLVGHSLSIADMAVWSYLAEARLKMEEDARQDREARKALERFEQFEALVRQFRSSSAPPSPHGLVFMKLDMANYGVEMLCFLSAMLNGNAKCWKLEGYAIWWNAIIDTPSIHTSSSSLPLLPLLLLLLILYS